MFYIILYKNYAYHIYIYNMSISSIVQQVSQSCLSDNPLRPETLAHQLHHGVQLLHHEARHEGVGHPEADGHDL